MCVILSVSDSGWKREREREREEREREREREREKRGGGGGGGKECLTVSKDHRSQSRKRTKKK